MERIGNLLLFFTRQTLEIVMAHKYLWKRCPYPRRYSCLSKFGMIFVVVVVMVQAPDWHKEVLAENVVNDTIDEIGTMIVAISSDAELDI